MLPRVKKKDQVWGVGERKLLQAKVRARRTHGVASVSSGPSRSYYSEGAAAPPPQVWWGWTPCWCERQPVRIGLWVGGRVLVEYLLYRVGSAASGASWFPEHLRGGENIDTKAIETRMKTYNNNNNNKDILLLANFWQSGMLVSLAVPSITLPKGVEHQQKPVPLWHWRGSKVPSSLQLGIKTPVFPSDSLMASLRISQHLPK